MDKKDFYVQIDLIKTTRVLKSSFNLTKRLVKSSAGKQFITFPPKITKKEF